MPVSIKAYSDKTYEYVRARAWHSKLQISYSDSRQKRMVLV